MAAYTGGRLTSRELGSLLGLDMWGVADLLAGEGVAAAQGSAAETRAALDSLLRAAPAAPATARAPVPRA
ncbi:MAG: hypothetical protein ACT4PP_01615 [Sporichthyaceae bacterium]